MAKEKAKQVIFTVEEEVYKEFRDVIKEAGETPTQVFRKFITETILDHKLKNNVMADHFQFAYDNFMEEFMEARINPDYKVSLIPFNARGHFRKSESITPEEKEEMLEIAEGLLEGRMADAYDAIKLIIDSGEFLGLAERGAYKPVIVQSLAGFALVSYDLEMENEVYGDDEEMLAKKRK